MFDNSNNLVTDSDHLQLIAGEHIQYRDHNVHVQACLPQRIVESISKDTAMKSLHRPLPPFSNRSNIQVGMVFPCIRSL